MLFTETEISFFKTRLCFIKQNSVVRLFNHLNLVHQKFLKILPVADFQEF
jgi:hypothetical protein